MGAWHAGVPLVTGCRGHAASQGGVWENLGHARVQNVAAPMLEAKDLTVFRQISDRRVVVLRSHCEGRLHAAAPKACARATTTQPHPYKLGSVKIPVLFSMLSQGTGVFAILDEECVQTPVETARPLEQAKFCRLRGGSARL